MGLRRRGEEELTDAFYRTLLHGRIEYLAPGKDVTLSKDLPDLVELAIMDVAPDTLMADLLSATIHDELWDVRFD